MTPERMAEVRSRVVTVLWTFGREDALEEIDRLLTEVEEGLRDLGEENEQLAGICRDACDDSLMYQRGLAEGLRRLPPVCWWVVCLFGDDGRKYARQEKYANREEAEAYAAYLSEAFASDYRVLAVVATPPPAGS